MRAHKQIPLLLLASLLIGCAGYRKGALPNTQTASVFLKPVQNEAYISGFASLFQSELRRGILESRVLNLAPSEGDADFVAYVRIADYEEQPIGYLQSDTGQPISSRISLSAFLTLTENDGNGTVLAEEKRISANSAVYSSPSTAFANPVDQTKPSLAKNLAQGVLLEIELQRP